MAVVGNELAGNVGGPQSLEASCTQPFASAHYLVYITSFPIGVPGKGVPSEAASAVFVVECDDGVLA